MASTVSSMIQVPPAASGLRTLPDWTSSGAPGRSARTHEAIVSGRS
jgi:hypothetical protein